jgi:hypothetical protein
VKSSIQQEVLRFEDLFVRLKRNKTLSKNTEIMHFLLTLSGEGNNANENAGGVLESVFQNKILN